MVLISPSFSGWNLAKTALSSSNSGKGPKNRPTNVSRLFIAESVHRVSAQSQCTESVTEFGQPADINKLCALYISLSRLRCLLSAFPTQRIHERMFLFVCLFLFFFYLPTGREPRARLRGKKRRAKEIRSQSSFFGGRVKMVFDKNWNNRKKNNEGSGNRPVYVFAVIIIIAGLVVITGLGVAGT